MALNTERKGWKIWNYLRLTGNSLITKYKSEGTENAWLQDKSGVYDVVLSHIFDFAVHRSQFESGEASP